jgi:membrane-associated protein
VTTHLLDAATAFVHWLATLDTWLVMIFTALSTAVEMTFLLGLLVPGESVVMLAGSLDSPAGFALAVIVGTAGGLLGQIGGYLIGRALGARLRDTRLGRRIGTERWNRAEAYLRDNGASALVAVRFVAVIHSVVPIVAGTARMPFGRFLGWSALGTVLWVSAFAGVGALTADVDSSGGIGLVLTAIGATCLGLIPLGVKLVRRLAGGTPTADPVAADSDPWTAGTPAVVAAAAGRGPGRATHQDPVVAGLDDRHPGRRRGPARNGPGRGDPGRGAPAGRPRYARPARRGEADGRGADVRRRPSHYTGQILELQRIGVSRASRETPCAPFADPSGQLVALSSIPTACPGAAHPNAR